MDVHEEAYYYAATTMPASVGDVDETDLYDDALRSHPISTHPAEDDQYSSDPGGYADYSNKNNFGIALGIFCIGLFQFQAPIRRWIRHRVNLLHHTADGESSLSPLGTITTLPRTLLDGLLLFVISVLDYLVLVYQISVQAVRRNRWWPFSPYQRSKHNPHYSDSRGRCNSLPELEDCTTVRASAAQQPSPLPPPPWNVTATEPFVVHPDDNDQNSTNNLTSDKINTYPEELHEIENWDWGHIPVELEPAFLEEHQYPPDAWMEYHPTLRVIQRPTVARHDGASLTAAAAAAAKRQHPNAPQSMARYPTKEKITFGPSYEAPSVFEEEKKDDVVGNNIQEGDDNTHGDHTATATEPEEGDAEFESGSNGRRSNETTPRQQQQQKPREKTTTNNKTEMPMRRSVVAT